MSGSVRDVHSCLLWSLLFGGRPRRAPAYMHPELVAISELGGNSTIGIDYHIYASNVCETGVQL